MSSVNIVVLACKIESIRVRVGLARTFTVAVTRDKCFAGLHVYVADVIHRSLGHMLECPENVDFIQTTAELIFLDFTTHARIHLVISCATSFLL